MIEKEKFSVICAMHDHSKYASQTIDSVIKQTYDNWEMIIVDDCSKDNTYEVAKKFENDKIKIFRNETRLYCANTYQKLVELATGEYCGVLDGDDVLATNAIERIVGLYKKYAIVSWIYTQSWWCNDELKPKRKGLSRMPDRGKMLWMGQRLKHCYSHWRTFKTELREKRNPLFEKDLKCAVDKALGYVLEELAPGGFLDECLYYYRYHRENMSHKTAQRPVWRQIVERAVKRRRDGNLTSKGVIKII